MNGTRYGRSRYASKRKIQKYNSKVLPNWSLLNQGAALRATRRRPRSACWRPPAGIGRRGGAKCGHSPSLVTVKGWAPSITPAPSSASFAGPASNSVPHNTKRGRSHDQQRDSQALVQLWRAGDDQPSDRRSLVHDVPGGQVTGPSPDFDSRMFSQRQ